jgi:poly(hydroxyalkanoate) depolymerase family esterase
MFVKNAAIIAMCIAITAPGFCATVTKTTTTLSSSVNPSTYGQTVSLSAIVTSADGAPPNGEVVTFKRGSTVIGTGTLSGGSAVLTISTLPSDGTDILKAVYPGDSNFATSTSNEVAEVVNKAATSIQLASGQNPANLGQSVTLTATVTPQFTDTVVTGFVSFYSGSKRLATVALSNGTASYATTSLALGNDSLTAEYNGSTSFNDSTSSALSESVDNGTFLNSTMTWDGITRYYQVYVPAVLPANPPMLLMLHGTTFGPTVPTTLNWGWQSIANEYSFIVVQPASTYNTNSKQWNWNSYFMDAAFQGTPPDDSGFLRQLIVNLTSQYKINQNMIFVTGFSSGAQMTERVGVEISDLVAAISPTSGQMEGQQAAPPPVLTPGNVVKPISVQEWHGTADTELPPCNYGTTLYSDVAYYLDTVDDTFNYWVQQNSCTALQTTQTLCTDGAATSGLSGNVATSCVAGNIEVMFNWEAGVGHAWTGKYNASRWLFFAAHPKE